MARRGNHEGSIYYQTSRSRWIGAVTLENGTRKALYGKTRQEVARKLASALRDVEHGLPLPGGQLTVGKYLADWLEQSARPKLKPATFRSYEGLVRVHIAPALGKHRL